MPLTFGTYLYHNIYGEAEVQPLPCLIQILKSEEYNN